MFLGCICSDSTIAALPEGVGEKGAFEVNIKAIVAGIAILASSIVIPAFAASGADTYKAKCQMCHGAAGQGNAAMKVKPITDPSVKSQTEAQMIAAVTNGSGKMPAYKGKLTDAQIKDAVSYFRTFLK